MNMRRLIDSTVIVLGSMLPQSALAQVGLQPVPPPAGTASSPLPVAIINILNVLLIFAALAALVFLIIGGFQYIISRGDEDAAATAKNTILYAIIGLIVIGLAAAAVNFVIRAVAGA